MIELVHGNRFEDLAAQLAEDLVAARRSGTVDLYTPVVVAVPGPLVAGGLRLALARRLGIAANLRFPSLETLFAELLARARPDWLVLQRRMLQSLLVALLADDERLVGDELAPVRRYAAAGAARGAHGVTHHDPVSSPGGDRPGWEVRRVQLAGELAGLFTDYAHTRPEMVAGWSRGEGEGKGEGWQPRLWRELAAAAERAAQRAGRSRAGLVTQLFAELPPGELAGVGPVHVFGFSYLARGVRPLLARLARAVEVRIYSPNPCREFWEDAGDAPGDNPALAAWGRAAREHVAALNELDAGRFAETFTEPAAAGALGRLQRDILERAPRRGAADRPATTASGDASVRVLACPGVRRELEAIGGAITGMLAADPSLRLCDIAILLAPDGCERYQAQIGAVFDELGGIAHRRLELPLAGESRVVQAVEALLDLPLGRFTRAELLGVMVHPAVMARFPEVDRDDWVRWCDELGIVHGGDRADHQGTYIEGDVYNWDQGLRRLALGSFMEVGERPVAVRLGAQAYVPARVAADERRSAARFALLARTLLAAARDQRDRPRPLAEWARDLDRLVAAHIAAPERDDEKVLARVRQCIRDLAELDLDGRAVDHATARELLREGMDHLRSPGGELPTDAVLVAPLGPMRALPCRVVFVAGLGAGHFPAGERASSLDLRAAAPRRAGDVSPRDRDRQAFLEALLAARERLVVSYVARDEETGEELEPSPLVHELEEILIEGYLAPEDAARLVERPPLRRWIAGSDPVSRRQAACAELRAELMRHLGGAVPPEAELERALRGRGELAPALGLAATDSQEVSGGRLARATRAEPLIITLAAVRRFLECPLQAWASAVLGVRGAEEEDLVAVSVEPFERDLLALSASLRSVFLSHLADGGGVEALERLHREAARRAEQGGRAPTGPFARGAAVRGMRVLATWRQALEEAAGRLPHAEVIGFGAVREGEVVSRLEPPIEIEVAGRPVLLTGRTEPVADDRAIGSIVLVTGKDWSPRHWLRGAMDAVALAAAGAEAQAQAHAMTIATGTGGLERVAFPPIDGAAARGWLAELVAELFAAPHDYLLPCEASLPQALGTAKGALADEVARLVDKKDGFFSSRGGPLRLPRHIAPPPEAEAAAMIARRFRLWRRPTGSPPVMGSHVREGTFRGGQA